MSPDPEAKPEAELAARDLIDGDDDFVAEKVADELAADEWLIDLQWDLEEPKQGRVMAPGAIFYRHLIKPYQCERCCRYTRQKHGGTCAVAHKCTLCPMTADSVMGLRRHKCSQLFIKDLHWLAKRSHKSLNGKTIDYIVSEESHVKRWTRVSLTPKELADLVLPPKVDYQFSGEFINPELFS